MSEPITFPSTTPAIGLPLLIAGQAQKEFFVNQALCVLDALNARTVVSSVSAPPAIANAGESFRVTAPASAAWEGREDHLALLIGGDWHFVDPRDGMQVFDQTAGVQLVFKAGWQAATVPAVPTGGSVIDTEARAAIGGLIQSLLATGMLGPASP